MPAPQSVEWSALSLASRETLRHIVTRLAAGYSYDEIAVAMERDRPELRHLPAPPRAYTKNWVAARARELRAEIESTGAAGF